MKATIITAIPFFGDISLYDVLKDVLPADHLAGFEVEEVAYGYVEKFKANVLSLRLTDPSKVMRQDLVYAVYYKGETVPVHITNQMKKALVNWGFTFYHLGMFDVEDANRPFIPTK